MKKKTRKSMTAAELMEKLSKDKAFQARAAERDKQLGEKKAARIREQKELLHDLADVGVDVASVWDLVNTGRPYPEAIPVLLNHLQRPYSDRTKEGLARALAVPEAKEAWTFLMEAFEKDPDNSGRGPKFAMGCALSVIARVTRRYDEVVRLLRDKRHGMHRIALLDALALSNEPFVRSKLQEFINDPDIGKQTRLDLKHPGRQR